MTAGPIIQVQNLNKTYDQGFQALDNVSLNIHPGEIFALLGPNGAGKTTLISMICGLTTITSGQVLVDNLDTQAQSKKTRALIGLVPQELTTDMFETVWDTVTFTRGLFGLPPNPNYIETLLKNLSLWDKKDNKLITLSGGMKRRVMIAKALSHEPKILFLDEPTAGVDVELRRDMWDQIHALRKSGVTIILTTHYIEEAEEMADRIGVINRGKIIVVEKKVKLIDQLGKKHVIVHLAEPLSQLPPALSPFDLKLDNDTLIYDYNAKCQNIPISDLFDTLKSENVRYTDVETKQSTLEEIFVELLRQS